MNYNVNEPVFTKPIYQITRTIPNPNVINSYLTTYKEMDEFRTGFILYSMLTRNAKICHTFHKFGTVFTCDLDRMFHNKTIFTDIHIVLTLYMFESTRRHKMTNIQYIYIFIENQHGTSVIIILCRFQ